MILTVNVKVLNLAKILINVGNGQIWLIHGQITHMSKKYDLDLYMTLTVTVKTIFRNKKSSVAPLALALVSTYIETSIMFSTYIHLPYCNISQIKYSILPLQTLFYSKIFFMWKTQKGGLKLTWAACVDGTYPAGVITMFPHLVPMMFRTRVDLLVLETGYSVVQINTSQLTKVTLFYLFKIYYDKMKLSKNMIH